jgi:hypothetical protein
LKELGTVVITRTGEFISSTVHASQIQQWCQWNNVAVRLGVAENFRASNGIIKFRHCH